MMDALLDKTATTLAYGGALAADHPGVTDPEYRRRRAVIADLAARYRPGDPIPAVPYTDREHDVWRLCARELAARHAQHAPAMLLDAATALGLPDDHVPQLTEVTDLLAPLTGFSYEPVPGLVAPRDFYGALAHRRFMSTQYIRHHSVPHYTPEPDVIHEVIGHATQLASPRFAELYVAVGRAARRLESDDAVTALSRVFWFTIEFGVVREHGTMKAYGAGILSSFGELESFRTADVRAFDIAAMVGQPYDITRYQPVLFAADSVDAVVDELGGFLATCDDDLCTRYLGQAA